MSARSRTLAQERAEEAWKAVEEVKKQAQREKSQEDYKKRCAALARRLPALIRSNGLGQTLAFLKSKDGEEHTWIANSLSKWVKSQLGIDSSKDLLGWIVNEADQRSYRYATQEALAYLLWLKRFAESELK